MSLNLLPVHLVAILFLLENSKGNLLTWLAKDTHMSSVFYTDITCLIDPEKSSGTILSHSVLEMHTRMILMG